MIERRSHAPIVDFSFFRSRSFLGANVVAFAISFGMFAVFFFLALYMQNILGYSPLETGVRFLPSTLVIMVAGPLAGRLADRIGPRTPLVIGLSLVTASLAWQSRIQVDTSFGFLVVPFILLGLGMGFTMSPMSTAAMNAVDRTKAGVASGTLSMTRMVGGTFGVAALGALVASDRPPRPRAVAARTCRSRCASGSSTRSARGAAVIAARPRTCAPPASSAFVDALGAGLTIAAIATALAALAAWLMIDPDAAAARAGSRVAEPEAAMV